MKYLSAALISLSLYACDGNTSLPEQAKAHNSQTQVKPEKSDLEQILESEKAVIIYGTNDTERLNENLTYKDISDKKGVQIYRIKPGEKSTVTEHFNIKNDPSTLLLEKGKEVCRIKYADEDILWGEIEYHFDKTKKKAFIWCVDGLNKGDKSPDFNLPTLDGKQISLSELSDKTIVMNFWASYCLPCLKKIQEMKTTYPKYAKDSSVQFISISLDYNIYAAQRYLEQSKLPWPQVYVQGGIDSDIANTYQIFGIPRTIIINKGKISVIDVPLGQLENKLETIRNQDSQKKTTDKPDFK